MQYFDLIIIIPVGPECRTEFLEDTIESARHYCSRNHLIIIADDSQRGTGERMKHRFPEVIVLPSTKNLGKVGGLYINLARAYCHALNNYRFKAVLKMDDDALIIGHGPELQALALFEKMPRTGMAGRHISGSFSEDCYGNIHDNYWPRKQLIKDTCSWKIIRRPIANLHLRKYFLLAIQNGYELGENIQGGAYFLSYACLQALRDKGLLPANKLGSANFGEDLMFSLLVKAAGFCLADIAGTGGSIGCAWKGLPAQPQQLYQDNRKVIHSIRFWLDMSEADIRRYFRELRLGVPPFYQAATPDPAANFNRAHQAIANYERTN